MNYSAQPSDVPAIRIHRTDDASALFNGGDIFTADIDFSSLQDASVFACPQGLQADFMPPITGINHTSDLDDLSEFAHLTTTTTTNQPFLTGNGYSFPYVAQDNASSDRGLSPSSFGSSLPSPTPSYNGSLSPSSLCDPFFSDSDSLLSLSPVTPESSLWPYGLKHQSNESLVSHPHFIPNDTFALPPYPHDAPGPIRPRSKSSPSRNGPVASKAMLEANGRRRRHPAQFRCEECPQTFTALFSLKRHQQSHTGERPYECGIQGCSQRFYNSSDCKRHERSIKRHKDLLQ